MKLFHTSDTHGYFPDLKGDFDAVIHSGDFIPNNVWGANRHRSMLDWEKAIQEHWVKANAETIKEWLGGRPFLFCSGNHDFIDPCEFLQEAGVNAINLDNKVTEFEGKTLWGLPWVPFIEGAWSHELQSVEMKAEIDRMFDGLKERKARPDILVAHSPPHGILDGCLGEHLGNTHLVNSLNYTFEQLPDLVFLTPA